MRGNPAGPGGPLTSKPTRPNALKGVPPRRLFLSPVRPRLALPTGVALLDCHARCAARCLPERATAGRERHGRSRQGVSDPRKGPAMGLLLLIVLIVLLVGGLP